MLCLAALWRYMVKKPAIGKIHPQVIMPEIPPFGLYRWMLCNAQHAMLEILHPARRRPPFCLACKRGRRAVLMRDLPIQPPNTCKIG